MAAKFRRLWALLLAVLTDGTIRVTLHGRTAWLHPQTLKVLPALAGADGDDEDEKDEPGDDDADADGGDDPDKTDHSDRPNWEAQSRKHEREAKKERKAREAMEKKLAEQADADKTEQQKAIDTAREEGRTEALTASEKERRADRLEVAVTRLAAKGLKVGDATKRFADPEDALVNIERALRNGDIDDDELFDSGGKVQTDALTTALADLLDRKPHLGTDHVARPAGDADGGKGSGGGKGLEDMSPDEHFAAIRRTGK